MPLVVLINCDSGPKKQALHLNIEQPTVRYSLYLILMSLSKVSPPLQFPSLFCFFLKTSCFSSVNLHLPEDVLCRRFPKWSTWVFSDLMPRSAGQQWPLSRGQWLLFGFWLKWVKYDSPLIAKVLYHTPKFKVPLNDEEITGEFSLNLCLHWMD